ncbi:tripartite tricarboxylate transporter permease [Streptomyces sp. NPDC050560]|uniref:tripartite tricarboxylate transporter permease n=1 Tax=Streptomyces sp. NPDC050560 TaxID=3365630 RepID=UPI0037AD958F
MADVSAGLSDLFTLSSLLFVVLGLLAGFGAGLLPGFSASNAAALVLGLTLTMSPTNALIFMGGIYAGDTFSGSVPAILLNIPGTPGAAATAFDGYPLAQQGKSSLAIAISRTGSAAGGVLAAAAVVVVIHPLSQLALKIGSREMCIVLLFGLMVIATVIGSSVVKGLLAASTGMLFGAVGLDPVSGASRMTFSLLPLADGIPLPTIIVGLFAVAGMVALSATVGTGGRSRRRADPADADTASADRSFTGVVRAGVAALRSEVGEAGHGMRLAVSYPWVIVRSAVIGLVIGIAPGAGTAVSSFVGYARAKSTSKHPELFGKGSPEGIVASEAADTSVTAGALVPTLALGIPGSATAAVMLSALYLHGLTPGPTLIRDNGPFVYTVLFGLLLCCLLILPLGILLAIPMRSVVRVRPGLLVPPILVLGLVGAYATRSMMFDLFLVVLFGLVGLAMRAGGYPFVPMILGLVLGPLMESNLDRALRLGDNQVSYFFGSTTAVVLWCVLAAVVGYASLRGVLLRRRPGTAPDRATTAD